MLERCETFGLVMVCFAIAGIANHHLQRWLYPDQLPLLLRNHFQPPLPGSARLIAIDNDDDHFLHPDYRYAFVFEVSDDALLEKLQRDWNLSQRANGQLRCYNTPRSEVLDMIPQDVNEVEWIYLGRLDEERRHDWNVWINRELGFLIAEYARW